MDNRKWLKRKYPKSFAEINKFLDDEKLQSLRKHKMKIGRLVRDVIHCQKYKSGSLIAFKRSNPVRSENYPRHYACIKCQSGYTSSGYHSISIFDADFIEIEK